MKRALSRKKNRLGVYTVIILALFLVMMVFVAWRSSTKKIVIVHDNAPLEALPIIVEAIQDSSLHPRIAALETWSRPEGSWHVALQIGHLEAGEAPEELQGLRQNTGAQVGAVTEVGITSEIAELIKADLESHGIDVTILPTTIPPNFYADVFLSLHADGSTDTTASGYKIASSRRDYTGKAQDLVSALETSYGNATGLNKDPNITRNMLGYYGFNWRRYDHSVHPMAVAAIVETGFVTNTGDRTFLTQNSAVAAKGIVDGVMTFLEIETI